MMTGDNILLDYKPQKLKSYEPEVKASVVKKVLMGLLTATVVICVIIFVFWSKVNEIGNEKSQTISMVSKNLLIYNMTWTLLPIHKFSQFYIYEIKDRMTCFYNQNTTECMIYCKDKHSIEGVTSETL